MKTVHINMSIDGIGNLFNYIRYGDAKFETIEPNLAKLNQIPNVVILISVASMNYNALVFVLLLCIFSVNSTNGQQLNGKIDDMSELTTIVEVPFTMPDGTKHRS